MPKKADRHKRRDAREVALTDMPATSPTGGAVISPEAGSEESKSHLEPGKSTMTMRFRGGDGNKRSSELMKNRKGHFLQGRFHYSIFWRVLLVHLLFPLSLPYVICRHGVNTAANHQFIYSTNLVSIWNSWITYILMIVNTVGLIFVVAEDPRVDIMYILMQTMFIIRAVAIAIKYSTLAPVEFARFSTTPMQDAEISKWLMASWMQPTPILINEQLQQAALSLDVDLSQGQCIWFSMVTAKDLQKMLSTDTFELDTCNEGKVTTLNLILAMFHKVNSKRGSTSMLARLLVLATMPIIMGVSVVFVPPSPPLTIWAEVHFFVSALLFTWFGTIIFVFLQSGVVDYKRRLELWELFNQLIKPRVLLQRDDEGHVFAKELPPLIQPWHAHTTRQLLTVRILLKRMGYVYRLRIQAVLGMTIVTLLLMVIAIIVLALVGWIYAGIVSAVFVVLVLMILVSCAEMILAGGKANDTVHGCRTAFLQAQLKLLSRLAQQRNPEYSRRMQKLMDGFDAMHRHMGDGVGVEGGKEVVNPAFAATGSSSGKQAQPKKAKQRIAVTKLQDSRTALQMVALPEHVELYDPRYDNVSVAELQSSVKLISNALEFMEHFNLQRPITFLGVRARLAVLITAGTLVLSASSVGLRSVALSLIAYVRDRLG